MNQPIRQLRPAHCKQAHGKQGFSNVLVGIIVAVIIAGVGGYVLVSQQISAPVQQSSPQAEVTSPQSEKVATEQVELIPPVVKEVPQDIPTGAPEEITPELVLPPTITPEPLPQKPAPTPDPNLSEVVAGGLAQVLSQYMTSPSGWFPPAGCEGDAVTFTSSPVDENRITFITPLGRLNGSHVTPTDHGYINTVEGNTASVRSPAAGEIVDIGTFHGPNDFRVTIWHSCTVSTIYIHLTDLAPEIRAHVGNLQPGDNWFADMSNPLYISAGQTIGTMRGSVDFSVHDTNVILSGFVTPSLYYGEPWKIHTVDLYDYFAEPLRTTLRGKSERTVEPIGGKIDYDIDGRLVGSWFLEGTGGYSGGPGDYWLTHLAVAYDHVNPDLIMVSIPNSGIDDSAVCNTCFNVYGVKGNAPDPADISVATGVVKYELMGRGYYSNQTLGVFLVEMLGDRRVRAEVFPNTAAGQVSSFTSAARIYER